MHGCRGPPVGELAPLAGFLIRSGIAVLEEPAHGLFRAEYAVGYMALSERAVHPVQDPTPGTPCRAA